MKIIRYVLLRSLVLLVFAIDIARSVPGCCDSCAADRQSLPQVRLNRTPDDDDKKTATSAYFLRWSGHWRRTIKPSIKLY